MEVILNVVEAATSKERGQRVCLHVFVLYCDFCDTCDRHTNVVKGRDRWPLD